MTHGPGHLHNEGHFIRCTGDDDVVSQRCTVIGHTGECRGWPLTPGATASRMDAEVIASTNRKLKRRKCVLVFAGYWEFQLRTLLWYIKVLHKQ